MKLIGYSTVHIYNNIVKTSKSEKVLFVVWYLSTQYHVHSSHSISYYEISRCTIFFLHSSMLLLLSSFIMIRIIYIHIFIIILD